MNSIASAYSSGAANTTATRRLILSGKWWGTFPLRWITPAPVPRFSLILDGEGGQLLRKTYTFEGYRVRLAAKEPYQVSKPAGTTSKAVPAPSPPRRRKTHWYSRMIDGVRRLFH